MKKILKAIFDKLDESIGKVYPKATILMLMLYILIFGLVQAFYKDDYLFIRFNVIIIFINLIMNCMEIGNVKYNTLTKTLIGVVGGVSLAILFIFLTKNIELSEKFLCGVKGITSILCYMSILPYGQIINESKAIKEQRKKERNKNLSNDSK